MSRYEGLNVLLRQEVLDRDSWRCRWCGATNQGRDLHHITYRRARADDVPANLITLCRRHHEFVHGLKFPGVPAISKHEAQDILRELVTTPGVTGLALRRRAARLAQLAHQEA